MLAFLLREIRKRRGWGKVLATKNKKCETEFWSRKRYYCNIYHKISAESLYDLLVDTKH